jgi:hypothetical protein
MITLSSEQQRLLQGMGYTLLRRADAPRPGVAESRPDDVPAQTAPALSEADQAPHPLWPQILHALGGPADRAGLFLVDSGAALQFDGPRLGLNLDALRQDADAKRRLWQTLRALRPE